MRFSKFIGRVLLAILYVNVGISHFINQESYIHYINIRYPVFYKYAQNLIGTSLDQFETLKPINFNKYSANLILGLGIIQLLLGFCVGIGSQKAGYMLAILTVIITAYAHNPLIYSQQVDIEREYLQIIFNVGIIGALFLIRNSKKTIHNNLKSNKNDGLIPDEELQAKKLTQSKSISQSNFQKKQQ